jgi:hypothetical protein
LELALISHKPDRMPVSAAKAADASVNVVMMAINDLRMNFSDDDNATMV